MPLLVRRRKIASADDKHLRYCFERIFKLRVPNLEFGATLKDFLKEIVPLCIATWSPKPFKRDLTCAEKINEIMYRVSDVVSPVHQCGFKTLRERRERLLPSYI